MGGVTGKLVKLQQGCSALLTVVFPSSLKWLRHLTNAEVFAPMMSFKINPA